MKKRLLATYLKRDAGFYPIVTLTGPRQSGKTTLARLTFPKHAYVSLEEPDQRAFAKEDPKGFLKRFEQGAILDEVQRVPELFSYLQTAVDADATPGRFVLTGSHNFLLMEQVSQSLAGRCGILHLLPFSRAELEEQAQPEPVHPRELFANKKTQLALWETIFTGFYPRIHDRQIPAPVWLADYVQTYLDRDVRQLVHVGDLDTFARFLKLCAGRAGQLLNYSSLALDAGISVDTARRWISVLAASFIVFLLPPYHRNFNKRLTKTPKLYFYDTGLAAHLLGLREAGQLADHAQRGALFENYAVAEVAKAYYHHRRQPALYFWRDLTGHEVDLLIEEGRELLAVEFKSTQTVTSDLLDTLRWWQQTSRQPAESACLLYGGDERYTRHDFAVLPWFAV